MEGIKLGSLELNLPNEIEVLATNILNDLTLEDFKHSYPMRWGVETFFHRVKNRLNLENFTGKSKESVWQDFWSTILVCNREAVASHKTNQDLKASAVPRQVNKSVSFNVIKELAFDILLSNKPAHEVEQMMESLFLTNAIPRDRDRPSTPRNRATRRTIRYLKYKKKSVF